MQINKNILFRIIFVSLLLFAATSVMGDSYYFYIQLKDKTGTPYSVSNPSEYLSARALSRRNAYNAPIDSTDLPVNPAYVSQIAATGVIIHSRTKWLNGVTVLTQDSNLISTVRALPFVSFAQYTGKKLTSQPVGPRKSKFQADDLSYGIAIDQVTQLKGQALHNSGATGAGIIIGLLDAGFRNANINPAFDSLRLQNRLLGVKNIVSPLVDVYGEDTHGANVLSIMTGNLPGSFLGAAPHASYWLIRTEYAPTEYLCEVDFWVSGIEFADSVGVDIINSSLGYTEFDDPSMNYKYSQLDGKVSRASIAASMAAGKGMLVCNSAGNSGNDPWKYISAPADATDILAVGSVSSTGVPSPFSSWGPASDGRIKPDVTARGTATAYVNTSGTPSNGNGTSYSSPVIAGMSACLLQHYRNQGKKPMSIKTLINAIIESTDLYLNPDAQKGYGIPDFGSAMQKITTSGFDNQQMVRDYIVYSDNDNREMIISIKSGELIDSQTLTVYSSTGKPVLRKLLTKNHTRISTDNLPAGIYIMGISGRNGISTFKLSLH